MRHQRSLRVGLLFVDGCGCGKSLVAIEINLGICQLRLILRFLGDRLVELRLIDNRIDPRQHVAFLYVVAFLEVDAQQPAVHLRTHGDGVERFDRTHGFEIDRDIGTCDGWLQERGPAPRRQSVRRDVAAHRDHRRRSKARQEWPPG